jgi:hypothetical protein
MVNSVDPLPTTFWAEPPVVSGEKLPVRLLSVSISANEP